MLPSAEGSELEDVEDALVDGDVAYQRGTAAAAFRHRDFRIVYIGTFSSNIGTWMQNIVLGKYALDLTHSGFFVGLFFGFDLVLFGAIQLDNIAVTILPFVGLVGGVALAMWAPRPGLLGLR